MLQIKNLSKSYGAKKAVSNLSFVVEDGDIMGFIGKNGAGKSSERSFLTALVRFVRKV